MNTLKTGILLIAIGALSVGLGGMLFGMKGAMLGLTIALLLQAFAFFNGHKMALRYAHAEPLQPGALPWLEDAVRQLSAKAGIPEPGMYISPDPQPNAFAAGRKPEVAVVCINRGLIEMMPQEQVIAVLAHELAHIRNRDTLTMTVTAAMASFVNMLAYAAYFFGDRDRSPLVGLFTALLAPITATMIHLAISRTREFAADRMASELMGTPVPMMGALRSLEKGTDRIPSHTATPATASMYIASPLHGGLMGLFSTHPPIEKRVEALQRLV